VDWMEMRIWKRIDFLHRRCLRESVGLPIFSEATLEIYMHEYDILGDITL